MYPLFLAVLAVLPYAVCIDCRAACLSCRDRRSPPDTMQVHCSMCKECRGRKRESNSDRLWRARAAPDDRPPAYDEEYSVELVTYRNSEPEYQEHEELLLNCPTQPDCHDEYEWEPQTLTSSTTIVPTCPPIVPCKSGTTTEKWHKQPRTPRSKERLCPCAPMCPCPIAPWPYPMMPQIMAPPPMVHFMPQMLPMMPMPPSMPPPMPLPVPPMQPMPPIYISTPQNDKTTNNNNNNRENPDSRDSLPQTTSEFYFVYVGVPKDALRSRR